MMSHKLSTLLGNFFNKNELNQPSDRNHRPKDESETFTDEDNNNRGARNGSKYEDEAILEELKFLKCSKESFEQPSLIISIFTYIGLYLLIIVGYINQVLFVPKIATEKHRDGYVPLFDFFERIYLHYVFRRFIDCVGRPTCSVPSDIILLKDRISHDFNWTFKYTGTITKYINFGSYNYLGFAQNKGPCAEESIKTVEKYGIATCSSRFELGTNQLHLELESLTAQFLGVDDSLVFGMGFATNSFNLPCLLSRGCLAVSDEKNHASIILGIKLSGATTKIFKHNDMKSLVEVIEKAIIEGQPDKTPWRKIVIITEGIFSMEGSIVKLPEIIAIKKKYGAYVYLDEAHSVGAMGPHGRGVTDYYGVDPKDVDILMGTFSKSFGSAGGYIAGNKKLINFLRCNSHGTFYASSMTPVVAQQTISSMKIIMGLDGTSEGQQRINQLARNTRYFRRRMTQIGVIIYGHEDSPVVPMVAFNMSKSIALGRHCIKKGIGLVGASFPAVPVVETRVRFCISTAHSHEQLDYVLSEIDDITETLGLKLSSKLKDPNFIEY